MLDTPSTSHSQCKKHYNMTKTLQDEQRRKLNFFVPLLIFGANAAFVVLCHSLCSDYLNHASSSSSSSSPSIGNIIALVERLKEGPDSLLTLDKVFFFVLLLLAFELLNYITENSGRKFFHWLVLSSAGSFALEFQHVA